MFTPSVGAENAAFAEWLDHLQERHLGDLTFREVRHALQALSKRYTEARDPARLHEALGTRGKRAAYALYYAPIHFLTVRRILERLPVGREVRRILDLGSGTGAGGAAAALALGRPEILARDVSAWALEEARDTYRFFGLRADVRRASLTQGAPRAGRRDLVLLGWVVNELAPPTRHRLLEDLEVALRRGAGLLLLEPIARTLTPWWNDWASRLLPLGAQAREWKLPVELPEFLHRLGKAAGLHPRTLAARSLYRAPGASGP